MNRRDLQKPVDPEEQFRIIKRQAEELVWEVTKAYPDTTPHVLARKVKETWHNRPLDADKINLLWVSPCLCLEDGFRGESKMIYVEI